MTSNIRITKKCVYCGNEFIAKTVLTMYCSHNCNRRHYKLKLKQAKIQLATQPENNFTYQQKEIKECEYLSITQTCVLVGISRTTLYRLLKSNRLNHINIGRRVIIRKLDIERLYDQT